jgi:AcrR family transcriptional regulator
MVKDLAIGAETVKLISLSAMSTSQKQPAKTAFVGRGGAGRAASGNGAQDVEHASGKIPPQAPREPRGVRRKRETRARLMDAAFRLIAARGADSVAIHEITEAADVATGGFYNHFRSKEDIYLEVTKRAFEDFADTLDVLVAKLEDPAEAVSVCIRHTVLRARRDPLWGQFLVREGSAGRLWTRGLGKGLSHHIEAGIERGRFKLADPTMSFIATGGAVLAAVAAQLHALEAFAGTAARASSSLAEAGIADIGERIALVALQILGLTSGQAERVTRKPLPEEQSTQA